MAKKHRDGLDTLNTGLFSKEEYDRIIEYYFGEKQRIRPMVDVVIRKLPDIYDMDRDDMYSDAFIAFNIACKKWDGEQKFEAFLQGILKKVILKRRDYYNASKRKLDRSKLSIYQNVSEDSECTYLDFAASSEDIEIEDDSFADERYQKYIDGLPELSKRVVTLRMDGYSPGEIKEILHISDNRYSDVMNDLKSYERTKVLMINGSGINTKIEEECKMINPGKAKQSRVKSRQTQYSVDSLKKKHDRYALRFDYPGQRSSGQWGVPMKSNLISDILQANPIPALVFAEQVMNEQVSITWNLDGKQRCTTCFEFMSDAFRISKKVTRYNIPYLVAERDDKGNFILDEDGSPVYTEMICDIRNKKYSDLPNELKEQFNDYGFSVTEYLNCTSEDLMYHINRHNQGKSMNASQKSMTELSEFLAGQVRSISEMPFFCHDNFTKSNRVNGTLERIVMESVMVTEFIDNWKKDAKDIAAFINEHADSGMLERIEENVEVLEEIVTDDVRKLFNAKETFIWLGLFAKFRKTGEDDKLFVDFMAEFVQSLHSKDIDGVTYDILAENRRTKDKATIVGKMNHLTTLMNEFLGIETEVISDDEDEIDAEEVEIDFEEEDGIEEDMPFDTSNCKEEAEIVEETISVAVSSECVNEARKCESFGKIPAYNVDKVVKKAAELCAKEGIIEKPEDEHEVTEDIGLALMCLEDYICEIDGKKSELLKEENLPGVILASAIIANNENIDDDHARKWIAMFDNKCNTESYLSGDYKVRANLIKKNLLKYLSFRNIAVA